MIKPLSAIFAGATGAGKTTLSKRLLKKAVEGRKPYIYDPNGEFREYGSYVGIGIKEFMTKIDNVTNAVILFEEATIFFKNKGFADTILTNHLIRKRHLNNVVIFNFHSLRAVPVDIMDYINYLFVLYTNDRETLIRTKFKDDDLVLDAYTEVQELYNLAMKAKKDGLYVSKADEHPVVEIEFLRPI